MRQIYLITGDTGDINREFISAFITYYKKPRNQNESLFEFARHVYRGRMTDIHIMPYSINMATHMFQQNREAIYQKLVDMEIILGQPFWDSIRVLCDE